MGWFSNDYGHDKSCRCRGCCPGTDRGTVRERPSDRRSREATERRRTRNPRKL